MVTCSFFGHDNLYDCGLYAGVLKAVSKVVAQDTEIEFVTDRDSPFQYLCLSAVLEARQRNPDKKLTLTFIARCGLNAPWQRGQWNALIPSCVIDKVTVRDGRGREQWEWRREKRALIDQSDFLIGYEYADLRDSYYDLYEYAVRRPGLTVLDVTSRETARDIRDSMALLETKLQYILHAGESGRSPRDIGAELGVSGGAIREKDTKAHRQLRHFAAARYKQRRAELDGPPPVCAIVLPARMDAEDEERFRQVVGFLTAGMGVSTFLVERLQCRSQFVDYLLKARRTGAFRVELVTHYPGAPAAEGFVPPFDGVRNVDSDAKRIKARYMRALSALLDQSDFIICKSGPDSDPATVRQIQRHKRLKAFNLAAPQAYDGPK